MERPAARKFWIIAFAVTIMVIGACSAGQSSDSPTAVEPADDPTSTTAQAVESSAATTTTMATATTQQEPEEVSLVSFNDDFGTSIAPVLTNRCASCHNPGGPGSTHWPLENAGDASEAAKGILSQVASGVMPPWPAGPQSVAFHNDRGLREDEVEAIVAWANAGGELDVDPSTPLLNENSDLVLEDVDVEVKIPEPYQGSPDQTDDYRCFVFDPQLTEVSWLLGYDFRPDKTEVVHHAIGYMATASQRERAQKADDLDPGSGWECFGASGIGNNEIFLGWAPGQGPTEYTDGAGMLMEPGDFVILQIHYHFDNAAPLDQSALLFDFDNSGGTFDPIVVSEYVAPVEIPCSAEESGPLCDRDAAYAAALKKYGGEGVQADGINRICRVKPEDFAEMTDGKAWSSCTLPIYSFGEIVSVLGHEHEIGASFRMTLNPGSSRERVILDIPEWDFDWQYNYYPEESIVLAPGDLVKIECSWDRSLQDSGVEPSYILWADGTNDEMCFSTIVTRGGA